MTKEELKVLLHEYYYDSQYLKQKNKEIEFIAHLKTSTNKDYINEALHEEHEKINKVFCKKKFIEKLFDYLSQPHKTIMYDKYIISLTFDQIADNMNYSTKRIYQLHSEALDKIVEYVNTNEISFDK